MSLEEIRTKSTIDQAWPNRRGTHWREVGSNLTKTVVKTVLPNRPRIKSTVVTETTKYSLEEIRPKSTKYSLEDIRPKSTKRHQNDRVLIEV